MCKKNNATTNVQNKAECADYEKILNCNFSTNKIYITTCHCTNFLVREKAKVFRYKPLKRTFSQSRYDITFMANHCLKANKVHYSTEYTHHTSDEKIAVNLCSIVISESSDRLAKEIWQDSIDKQRT